MNSPQRRPRYIYIFITSLYVFCSFYIGCGGNAKKSSGKKPSGNVSAGTTPNSKAQNPPQDSKQGKDEDDDKETKTRAKKDKNSDTEEVDDSDEGKGSSKGGNVANKKSVRFRFTSSQMRAICATDVDTLYGLIRRVARMDDDEIKEMASTKVGKLFTESQLKDLKRVAAKQKKSDVEKFQSDACQGQSSKSSKEEDDDDDDVTGNEEGKSRNITNIIMGN